MNAFDSYVETKNTASERAKRFITEYFPYILIFMNVALMAASKLFEFGFKNPFSQDFAVSLFLNITTQTLSYAGFVAYGEQITKDTLKSYIDNLNAWGDMSAKIRMGTSFEKLIHYCEDLVEKEREERRLSFILNHTRLSIQQFNDEYRHLSPKELADKVKEGRITRSEKRYIKKATGRISVKPINPLVLLCGTKKSSINDAGRVESVSIAKTILLKPFAMIFTASIVSGIYGVYSGVSDKSVWFSMLISAFLIIFSAFVGYSKGVSSVKRMNDIIKVRILFLERFEKV